MCGIAGKLEKFVSHAAVRDDIRWCGLSIHRCMLIMAIICITLTLVMVNTKMILVGSGTDAKIIRSLTSMSLSI